MKTIYIILISALFAFGCKSESASNNSTSSLVSNTDPEVIIVDNGTTTEQETPAANDSTADTTIKFAMKTTSAMYFGNDDTMTLWKSEPVINKSGSMEFSVNSVIIQLDQSGETVETQALDATADVIKSTDSGTFFCSTVPAATAYSMGALYRTYSGIYKDNAILSDWFNNQYQCDRIFSIGSEVYAEDTAGTLHQLQGVYLNIEHVSDESFVIHDLDTVNKRIWFNDSQETYITNNILNAQQWILYADKYYSENGYTWSITDGLTESATAMSQFQNDPYPVLPTLPHGESPVLLRVGVHSNTLYWIECNSGWLFRYEPDQDKLTQLYRLYTGDGLHQTGIGKRKTLNPSIQEGVLYFSNDAVVYDIDLSTGFINIFFAAQGEVMDYE